MNLYSLILVSKNTNDEAGRNIAYCRLPELPKNPMLKRSRIHVCQKRIEWKMQSFHSQIVNYFREKTYLNTKITLSDP